MRLLPLALLNIGLQPSSSQCHNTVGGLTVTLNCCESLKSVDMGRSIKKKYMRETSS